MKHLWIAVALLIAGSSASALNLASGPATTGLVRVEDVPLDLSFEAGAFKVLNPSWFISLFPKTRACEATLNPAVEPGLKVWAVSSRQISVSVDGEESALLVGNLSDYVPVHYRQYEAIHPYFSIETANNWHFHLEIRKSRGKKILTLSLIQGRPGAEKLLPILTAVGK